MAACSSNQATPTGNGKADGKAFAKELLAAYHDNDIDRMTDTVDAFYDLYKEQDPHVVKDFFDSWLVEFHDMASDVKKIDDFSRFQKMTRQADKDDKLNDLYDKVMKWRLTVSKKRSSPEQ